MPELNKALDWEGGRETFSSNKLICYGIFYCPPGWSKTAERFRLSSIIQGKYGYTEDLLALQAANARIEPKALASIQSLLTERLDS